MEMGGFCYNQRNLGGVVNSRGEMAGAILKILEIVLTVLILNVSLICFH